MCNKVAFIINNINGMYLFRRELVETVAKDNSVIILAPEGPRSNYFRDLGCKLIETPVDGHGINPVKEIQLLRLYKRILKEERPDIAFTYTIKPNTYAGAACASLGIPYVANITGLGTAVENGGALQKVSIMLYRYGLRKCKKVFFQNTDSKNFMLSHRMVREEICELIPGSGVNLEYFKIIDYPNTGKVEFAFISRILKEKGIDHYFEAAKYIKIKYPNTEFHVCGLATPEYEDKLNQLNNDGVIIYHGSVPDVREIHKISSCTILPSYYPEGISNALLESAACGRPIITTDRAGCKETVEDRVTGFIVKQKDTQDLIDKLEMFLSLSWNQRRGMGLAGRRKVEREFDRNIVVSKYLEEIESAGL